MADDMIHDRGRGPEIRGTRVTIQDLLTYFLDPAFTEDQIARLHDLTTGQVAAARSYILSDPETILVRHREIESRTGRENPPEVIDRMARTRESLQSFKIGLAEQRAEEAREGGNDDGRSEGFPSFKEWLAEQDSRPARVERLACSPT